MITISLTHFFAINLNNRKNHNNLEENTSTKKTLLTQCPNICKKKEFYFVVMTIF